MTRFINRLRHLQIKQSVLIGLGIIPVIAVVGVSRRYFAAETSSACETATALKSSYSSAAGVSPTNSVQLMQFRRYLDPNPEPSPTTTCNAKNPFDQSVRYALQASSLAQTAATQQQWDEVARYWVQAVAWMQAVPPNSPQRALAEKKVVEYMRNLAYSQSQAAAGSSALTFPSFDSEPLDPTVKAVSVLSQHDRNP